MDVLLRTRLAQPALSSLWRPFCDRLLVSRCCGVAAQLGPGYVAGCGFGPGEYCVTLCSGLHFARAGVGIFFW